MNPEVEAAIKELCAYPFTDLRMQDLMVTVILGFRTLDAVLAERDAETVELRRDKERLDFLMQRSGFLELIQDPNRTCTFREAIDAAMAKGGGQ